jgi:actin-related protein
MSNFDFDTEKPIIIDNGSHTIKAGWSGEDAPLIVFDNIIGKRRPDLRRVDRRP